MSHRTLRVSLVIATLAGMAAARTGPAGWCGTVPDVHPAGAAAQPQARPEPAATGPSVEVVFVLDTTGSMSGLIEGAKQTIWSIANAIATGDPTPQVRMGLVAYRDRGDEYITRITGLTDDLDAVYGDLIGFRAQGGGDHPESVNQALHEAITLISWSDDPSTLRLVYLVGDAPPHMHYDNDVPYLESCRLAAERGIIINTIQCGSHGPTGEIWREISRAAEGEYLAIAQDGGVAVVATPFDADISALGEQLGRTVVTYGSEAVQTAQAQRTDRARELEGMAPAPAAADRAIYNAGAAGGRNLLGPQELVDAVVRGVVVLEDVPVDELPEEMRAMSAEERAEYIRVRAAERARIQEQIQGLARQRQEFIDRARAEAAGEGGFDRKVLETLRRQAERFGIGYPGPDRDDE